MFRLFPKSLLLSHLIAFSLHVIRFRLVGTLEQPMGRLRGRKVAGWWVVVSRRGLFLALCAGLIHGMCRPRRSSSALRLEDSKKRELCKNTEAPLRLPMLADSAQCAPLLDHQSSRRVFAHWVG